MVRFAHASPDGRRVVYEALGNLWIKDIAGSAPPRRLTRADELEAYPAWSRDGRQIAYVAWDDDKGGADQGGRRQRRRRRASSRPSPAITSSRPSPPTGSMIAYRKSSATAS